MANNDWNMDKLFYGAVIFNGFDYIKSYYTEFSEYIKGQLSNVETTIAQLNNADEEIKDRYFDEYADDYLSIKLILEDNFTKSILISLYSFIENNLIFFCEKADHDLNIKKFKKSNNGIVKNSQQFLKKYLGVSLSKDSEQFITGINLVRNIFTHNDGRLNNIPENKINNVILFSRYNKVKGLIIDNEKGKIKISLDFIDYCMTQSKEYFKEILK